MSLKEKINSSKLPKHIAIIMDGNGRWAKQQNAPRIYGHEHGIKALRISVEGAAELGVKYLTLYTFSIENWSRPKEEVDGIMFLLIQMLRDEEDSFNKNGIRLQAIGELTLLSKECLFELHNRIEKTKYNPGMTLVLALSYSSRWEITNAVQEIAKQVDNKTLSAKDITEAIFAANLCTHDMSEIELLIRTSGEHRISNFLLWQLAYSELYFTDKLWPDFGKEDLYEAILYYQNCEHEFGKQVSD